MIQAKENGTFNHRGSDGSCKKNYMDYGYILRRKQTVLVNGLDVEWRKKEV